MEGGALGAEVKAFEVHNTTLFITSRRLSEFSHCRSDAQCCPPYLVAGIDWWHIWVISSDFRTAEDLFAVVDLAGSFGYLELEIFLRLDHSLQLLPYLMHMHLTLLSPYHFAAVTFLELAVVSRRNAVTTHHRLLAFSLVMGASFSAHFDDSILNIIEEIN